MWGLLPPRQSRGVPLAMIFTKHSIKQCQSAKSTGYSKSPLSFSRGLGGLLLLWNAKELAVYALIHVLTSPSICFLMLCLKLFLGGSLATVSVLFCWVRLVLAFLALVGISVEEGRALNNTYMVAPSCRPPIEYESNMGTAACTPLPES